jgi:LacI family transcriptional regulator
MPDRPRVAVLVPNFLAVTRAALGGIGDYTRAHAPWTVVNNPWEVMERGVELPPGPLDGLIACLPDVPRRLGRRRVATVLITERFHDEPIPRVVIDSAAVGRLGARHLIDRGFRHLAYAGYPRAVFARRRGEGFLRAARAAGLACRLYADPFPHHGETERRVKQTPLRRWLIGLPKPAGVMACNDRMAMMILQLCRDLGIRVPADLALVGADNDEMACDFCDPPLSSVDLNSRRAGYQAAALLHRLLQGRPPPDSPRLVRPAGVVTRLSSDIVVLGGERVGAAIKFMRDRACEGISVPDVVRAAGLPRRTLEKQCRRLLGRSPAAEIRRVQLDRARELLAGTDMAVGRIAEAVGLPEAKRLSEVFRAGLGTTPTAFRRRSRGARRAEGKGLNEIKP